MTPRKPLTELEADEFVCVRCHAVAKEHPMDGMGECPACAASPIASTTALAGGRNLNSDPTNASPGESTAVRDAVNAALHAGAKSCVTACTHVIVGRWTALGIANVIARADLEEADRG